MKDVKRVIKNHPVMAAAAAVGLYVVGRKHEQAINGIITPLIPVVKNPAKPGYRQS